MSALAVLLECAAVLVVSASVASALIGVVILVLRPLLRRANAAFRADALFMLGLGPVILLAAGIIATLAPSVLALFGLGSDHCGSHAHHAHLCVVHAQGARPALMAVGALLLAVVLFRLCSLASRAFGERSRLRQLEQVSRRTQHQGFPLYVVPGGAGLCHAAGFVTRRVFLAESLFSALGREEVDAALAHEAAHLRRRDPLRRMLVHLAGCFVLPPFGLVLQREYELAAEQACDADAVAAGHEGETVASALVAVARWMYCPPVRAAPAFGADALELRVRALLATPAAGRPVPGLLLGGALLIVAAIPLVNASTVHHAAESALHLLF